MVDDRAGAAATAALVFEAVAANADAAECMETAAAEAIVAVTLAVRARSIFATELSVVVVVEVVVLLGVRGGSCTTGVVSTSTRTLANSSCNRTPNDASFGCCTKTMGCVTI
jgi:hypothetical protein